MFRMDHTKQKHNIEALHKEQILVFCTTGCQKYTSQTVDYCHVRCKSLFTMRRTRTNYKSSRKSSPLWLDSYSHTKSQQVPTLQIVSTSQFTKLIHKQNSYIS
uniref:Uncharacterized protein n=1 Tax=Opuntia streptacantha TaxID=393608 RepID=A0A7C9CVK8_OPUST